QSAQSGAQFYANNPGQLLRATFAPDEVRQQLIAADGAANDGFGFSVALSGDTVMVGAGGDDIGANADQGSAYVFVRSGGVWTQRQKLTAADGAAGDAFGISVAISGDTVVVGAHGDAIGSNVAQGSAYVFVRSGGGWTQQQKLTADHSGGQKFFRRSLAPLGGTLVMGAICSRTRFQLGERSSLHFHHP